MKTKAEIEQELEVLRKRAAYYASLAEPYCCYYCGIDGRIEHMLLEHKTPTSRGGSNESTNLVNACRGCNVSKGSRTFDEFKALMRERTGDVSFSFFGESLYSFTKPEEPAKNFRRMNLNDPDLDDIFDDNAVEDIW